MSRTILILCSLCLSLLILAPVQAESKPDRWTALAYPIKSNPNLFKRVGEYATKADCRARAAEAAGDKGAWQCGLNCQAITTQNSLSRCEKSIKSRD